MSQHARKQVNTVALAILFVTGSCLPKDTRPPPAEVLVQAASDDAVQTGLTSDDGWHIVFSRYLVTLGQASINGDTCNAYAEGDYTRVLDMQQPSPQKVNLLYGLGTCQFSFALIHPREDSVIGAGVTADEALMMRTAGSDVYTSWTDQLAGINTYVVGSATKGSQSKHFAWPFRQDFYMQLCTVVTDAGPEQDLQLRQRESLSVELQVHGERLFQLGPLRRLFEPFAGADTSYGNNDGDVTLEELSRVPATVSGNLGGVTFVDGGIVIEPGALMAQAQFSSPDAGIPDAGPALPGARSPVAAPETLGDFLVYWLLPASISYQGLGICSHSPRRPSQRGQ